MNEDLRPLLQKAFFFLKFRPRTKKEIENYLIKKIISTHWSMDDVKKIISHLEKLEFINDKKFTQLYIENRNLLKPKGQKVLIRELIQHGVEKNIIDEYFLNTDIDEEKMALQTLVRRWGRYRNLEKQTRFKKAMSFLMRRGFNFDIVQKVLYELEEGRKRDCFRRSLGIYRK